MTQLCAIPSCRIRGRHQPGCDNDRCTGCLPRVADEGYACTACCSRTAGQLEGIIQLTPDARAVAAGLVRRGQGATGGKPGSRPPLNDGATAAVGAVENALTTLARDVAETRGLRFVSSAFDGHRVADPLVEAASWLTEQLGWLQHALDEQGTPYAVTAFLEIRDCVSRLRGIVNGPQPGRYAGPCSTEVDGKVCGQDVTAKPGAEVGTCKACGAEYGVEEQQEWMRRQIEDHLGRPEEIRGLLLTLGVRLGYSTLARYVAKGQIAAHGSDEKGKPLFRIGDVMNIRMGTK